MFLLNSLPEVLVRLQGRVVKHLKAEELVPIGRLERELAPAAAAVLLLFPVEEHKLGRVLVVEVL